MAPPDSAVGGESDGGAEQTAARGEAAPGMVSHASAAGLPLEVLERNLVSHRARIAADEARWLDWLRDYDQQEGWREWGCVSAAHWLSWKCAMGGTAARERVRVARAMAELPMLSAAFRAGRLTWSKMRALTRVATVDNEGDLVAVAAAATGAQLERLCAALRPHHDVEITPVTAFASRSCTKRRNHDGTTTFTVRVTDDSAAAIENQLDHQVTAIIDDALADTDDAMLRRDVIAERGGIAAVRADAAAALLAGRSDDAVRPTPVQLVVDVDAHRAHGATDSSSATTTNPNVPAETPNHTTTQPNVPAETPKHTTTNPNVPAETSGLNFLVGHEHVRDIVGRRLCCDPRITPILESALASSVSVGRSTRLIPAAMRIALGHRDNHCCRFPGCAASKRLHAHHIRHWVDGGPTELDNLVLLCHFHHHLVHDGGWQVTTNFDFIRPAGDAVCPQPDLLRHELEITVLDPDPLRTGAVTSAGPLPRGGHDRLDVAWACAVIADNEALARRRRLAAEPGDPTGCLRGKADY